MPTRVFGKQTDIISRSFVCKSMSSPKLIHRGLDHPDQAETYLYDTHTPMNMLQKGAVAVLSAAAAFRKYAKLCKLFLLLRLLFTDSIHTA